MGEVVYGLAHAKSVLGILKLLEILSCFLAVILVAAGGSWTNTLIEAFYAGTAIGIIISLVIFGLCLTEAGHSLNGILKYQFVVHLLLFIYILVVSSIMIARWYTNCHRAAGVFGLFASIFYLGDAGISYKAYGVQL